MCVEKSLFYDAFAIFALLPYWPDINTSAKNGYRMLWHIPLTIQFFLFIKFQIFTQKLPWKKFSFNTKAFSSLLLSNFFAITLHRNKQFWESTYFFSQLCVVSCRIIIIDNDKKNWRKNKILHNTPHLAVHWFSKLFSTSSWCCVFFIYNLRHRWKQERIDCKKEFLASTLIANIASYMKIFFWIN